MAVPYLTAPTLPQFADHMLRDMALVDRAMAQAHLTICYWSDEWCACKAQATVHDLKSEQDFCERHFRTLLKLRGEVARG